MLTVNIENNHYIKFDITTPPPTSQQRTHRLRYLLPLYPASAPPRCCWCAASPPLLRVYRPPVAWPPMLRGWCCTAFATPSLSEILRMRRLSGVERSVPTPCSISLISGSSTRKSSTVLKPASRSFRRASTLSCLALL